MGLMIAACGEGAANLDDAGRFDEVEKYCRSNPTPPNMGEIATVWVRCLGGPYDGRLDDTS